MIQKVFSITYQLSKRLYFRLRYKDSFVYGKIFRFRDKFRVNITSSEGKVEIGDNVFFNHDCSLHSHSRIKIGDYCMFGENVKIYDHNHVFKDSNTPIVMQGFSSAEVEIGDNCWIGSNVIILKGVHIGRHSVIGAGCVIYKDIPSETSIKCKQEYIIEVIVKKSAHTNKHQELR
ncbi:acyltransferase [Desulfosporosinus fructosivorans]|uniref:Acyltransferase n=1 Tax=Desulfosporosinus fructosivorans TaxID=2018669 RepID=A0A4Z0RAE8_9FIRM|nr:acyltransferase [Desulfosporosinus fructosivorans]TGE39740.1 acyltransferase [Desulfosporosinus fructosivorans]